MLPLQTLSLDHSAFQARLAETENLLIIQDLDGVCMGLVNDPLTRKISPAYLAAAAALDGHFYVLTNGEHVGKRGLQTIIERALGEPSESVAAKQLYLPGLAAGGVQWQDRRGTVSHPGVSQAELDFLASIPPRIAQVLTEFLQVHCADWSEAVRQQVVQASVLDNMASPTANLNSLHATFVEKSVGLEKFIALQTQMVKLMEQLLQEAEAAGLGDQFFVHYAPNLGRDGFVHEAVWFADAQTAGTTDFQFMLRGAVKEAGVLALLNHYFFERTGHYPLGVDFNARQAPRSLNDMLKVALQNFEPAQMPLLVGVGDTVTSQGFKTENGTTFKRGGSDRNFLQLIQNIGQAMEIPTLIAYVDSSGGELSNRRPVTTQTNAQGKEVVVGGIGDPRDEADPLTVNVVFPKGPQQYCEVFQAMAAQRSALSTE
ncbi:MAG: glucosylglycerol 3-phosphatase [Cyanobacteria bacterium J06614_10]